MSRHLAIAACTLLLSSALCGCVSTQTIAVNRSVLDGYHGATIVTTQRALPAFTAQTAGKATLGAFGLVGGAIEGAAVVKSGNAIIKNDAVPDPAVAMKQALLADLTREEGLKTVDSPSTTDTVDVTKLAKQYASADLVLDVQTTYWGFVYFPANWSHYRVLYAAKLRVIDTKNAKLLADGFCDRDSAKSTDTAMTRAQLLDNDAAGLKQQLAEATQYCLDEFRSKTLQENTVAQR